MKKFLLLFILFMLPLITAEEIGIGAQPALFNVTLGNETNIDNGIIQTIKIDNRGDIPIKVRMISDGYMYNFTRSFSDNLVIKPDERKDFLVYFDRNGTEEKQIEGRIRFLAEPDTGDVVKNRMIEARPAVDVKIRLHQLPMTAQNKERIGNIMIYGLVVVSFIIIAVIFYFSTRPEKEVYKDEKR